MKRVIITAEEIDRLISRDRDAQGLPPTIEDASVFREIATLLDEPQPSDVVERQSA